MQGAVNTRLLIDASGNVAVRGRKMLFLNFGDAADAARAEEFMDTRVAQGMEGLLKVVPGREFVRGWMNELSANAVPESMARQFPNSPLAVDVTKASNQFGLRAAQIDDLLGAIKKGSGR